MSVVVRFAVPSDAATIHRFIVDLATFEREPDAVEVDVEELASQMQLARPPFECVIAEAADDARRPLGFALFFHNYSTWRGRPGLYLEDLWVDPQARGRGVGLSLMRFLARLAIERGCARFEWSVLEWNEGAIRFYEAIGARPNSGWSVFRIDGQALARLATEP